MGRPAGMGYSGISLTLSSVPRPTDMANHRYIAIAAALAVMVSFTAYGVTSDASSAVNRGQIYSALTGAWTGQLEYRDFQSDDRVILPTWLEVKASQDGQSLQFAYTYDDGPTKTVTELSTVTIDTSGQRFTITSDRDHSSDSYQIEGMDGPNPSGRVRFTLTGSGKENDKAVEVRITVTIERNRYEFKKETRVSGKVFLFRDGYEFTRRTPAGR